MEELSTGGDPGWVIAQNVESLVQGAHNRFSSDRAFNFARQQHHDQIFQADTSYRRAVRDLQLAGLNPMLAFGPMGKGGGSPVAGVTGVPGASGTAGAFSATGAAQNALIAEEIRDRRATADRNEEIAKIIKAIGPRIISGVGAIEATAAKGGETAARVTELIKDFLGTNPSEKITNRLSEIVDRVIETLAPPRHPGDRFIPSLKMPRAILPGPPERNHPGWGIGEYERAQAERRARARSHPRRQQ